VISTWLWISEIVILCGAELDAEMEHQTARDTTTGPPKPIGVRGAHMADTVGAPAGYLPEIEGARPSGDWIASRVCAADRATRGQSLPIQGLFACRRQPYGH